MSNIPTNTATAFWSTRGAISAVVGVVIVAVLMAVARPGSVLAIYPDGWTIDLATPLGDFFKYMSRKAEIGPVKFSEITRAIGTIVAKPYELLKGMFASGFTFYHEEGGKTVISPLPWTAITAVFTIVAHHFGGRRLATGTFATFLFFAVFGIWEASMLTLTLVTVSVVLSTFFGLFLGLWGYNNSLVDRLLQPVYDIMQTLPLFSYLVPMILFFGFGPIASLMATVIFALPPMARVTTQALREVHASVKEFGAISGCTPRQLSWLVLIPAARKSLLLGVNQVIMLALSVVVIASLIGAGGLGGDVLKALKSMRIGDAAIAGVAVTFMAIVLDRISYAIAMRRPIHLEYEPNWMERNTLLVKCLGAMVILTGLSFIVPAFQTWPEAWEIRAGKSANEAISWISNNYYDQLGAFRDWFIIYLLKPAKLFLTGLPWIGVVAAIGVAGYLLDGWKLALLGIVIFGLIAVGGYWGKAMISLYLVSVSVFFATILGLFLGIIGAVNKTARVVLIASVDTLQTMPMFVYLIPVVMLFSIGEFPAFVAIVLYAVTPAIRYTISALDQVKPSLIEGGLMSGCTGWQLMTQIKLPLGFPTMLLGLNQVIMLAFGMLVITALVGTRGLEEITLVAIAKVRAGDGLLAGLAIAGMAIVFDRFIRAASSIAAYRMGVPDPQKQG